MLDCPGSLPDHQDIQSLKHKAAQAGYDGNTTGNSVKRRASKACQYCRARKVRCDFTEHGVPCTNCRLDETECIVPESRRKRKRNKDDGNPTESTRPGISNINHKIFSCKALESVQNLKTTSSRRLHQAEPQHDEHVPHSIYQNFLSSMSSSSALHRCMSKNSHSHGMPVPHFTPLSSEGRAHFLSNIAPKVTLAKLPLFIKPLPAKIGPDEVSYLEKKGALNLPKSTLRSEIFRAYVEFVHPYMPLLDLHNFLMIVDHPDGSRGRVSLILFQAAMFAGSAFVDMQYLRAAGYATRKEARKDFFQKTRLLYDFDYESNRVSLVQTLLLLTFYYETPNDQKDAWYWIGVATSVARTIGLHRNPEKKSMDSGRVKLWKRVWWSMYMRDCLIALGMRRPTWIKPEDFDVPILTLDDFELATTPDSLNCLPSNCRVAKDVNIQRQLAIMCIEKVKLCLMLSSVLSKQSYVLNNDKGLLNDYTTTTLPSKKPDVEGSNVKICENDLHEWVSELPEEAKYSSTLTGEKSLDLNLALMHMVFFTTLSALHRTQMLSSSSGGLASPLPKMNVESGILNVSRRNMRRAASSITSIARRLDQVDLIKYLPTTGVTVLLSAIATHLLDIKAPEEEIHHSSLHGFCQCMAIMGKLRDLYASADYSIAFLEAAIRKTGFHIAPSTAKPPGISILPNASPVTFFENLIDAGRPLDMHSIHAEVTATVTSTVGMQNTQDSILTTPPDNTNTAFIPVLEEASGHPNISDEEVARCLKTFLTSTSPEMDNDHDLEPRFVTHTSITIAEDTATLIAPTGILTVSSGAKDMLTAQRPFSAALNEFSTLDLPSDPFVAISHHRDDEILLRSTPMAHDFEDGDFDFLLDLGAVGNV